MFGLIWNGSIRKGSIASYIISYNIIYMISSHFWKITDDTDRDELENRLSLKIERPQRNTKWNVQATVII